LQGKSNEIEQLGKNVAALIRIADPPFSKIGSTQVPLLAAKHHVTDADPGLPARTWFLRFPREELQETTA
jgi:hypothetical protein